MCFINNGRNNRLFVLFLSMALFFVYIFNNEIKVRADKIYDEYDITESEEAASTSPYYNDDYANQVLAIVNKERAAQGLSALTMDLGLVETAKLRATEIKVTFSHTRPNGTSCFTAFPSTQTTVGENIASGYTSPNSVMNGWMNSSGHRANILNANFKSIGIACYYVPGSAYGYYWVQAFGNKVTNSANTGTGNNATGNSSTGSYTSSGTTVYNGVDYSPIYNYNYYINKYSDIKRAFGGNPDGALKHFVTYGMNEGRQASENFNVTYYKNRYVDLRNAYGLNLKSYYMHYINNGRKEGRDAKTYSTVKGSVTKYNGVDYSSVFNYNYYVNKYSDIKKAFGTDDIRTLQHFVNRGMTECRQAKAEFNVGYYRNN
ncbi:MAG: hypothetical protein IJ167_06185 [Lachnospiraceae bacterium]|nr:hypothetical protein [Lachnospiraceae bacterium]